MRLILGTHHLIAPAGADTYLITVAEQLLRLGHDVTVHALDQGPMADRARERGIVVTGADTELPLEVDGAIVHDEVVALKLAARYPHVPRVFVCHSDRFGIDTPPQVPGMVAAVVAMSDRVARYVEGMAVVPEIVRLRQPIDLERFRPAGSARAQARRLVAIGNYLDGERRTALSEVADELGLECRFFGAGDQRTDAPEVEMAAADIVVGKSRVMIEAMACGRAAYLYDYFGADGWVTPESYPAMEADAFWGEATDEPADRARLRRELAAYRPEMGMLNRDLAVLHHSVRDHAGALIDLLDRLRGDRAAVRVDAPLATMAVMAQRAWLAESALIDVRRQVDTHRQAMDELEGELRHQRDRSDKAEELARQAARAVEEIKASRRYRLAGRRSRPVERGRGR
ncbi:MAG TPA: hypothetical protein VNB64_07465 [Solirubrobacteraceae bacterium]|nr:hypothetical protein [Solirubrobacteraceae bacterium]